MSNVVFRPRQMTDLDLREGQKYVYGRFYSIPSILKRSFTVRRKLLARLLVNVSYRGINRGKGMHDRLPGQHRAQPVGAGPTPSTADAQGDAAGTPRSTSASRDP